MNKQFTYNPILIFIALLLLAPFFAIGQQVIKGDDKTPSTFTEGQVVDPDYGINKYDKLNFAIGGDSVRNAKKGYACQGWVEDYYTNAKLLHRGFYVDGQLKIYKNYFDNGQLEREFKVIDLKKASMKILYKDGKPKADIDYYDRCLVKETDYYENGQLKYIEEHTNNMEFLIQMSSYAEDGKPQSVFTMTDKKKKIFFKKEYNENGTLKEEGPMKYSSDVLDYLKDGEWKFYDDNGVLKQTDLFVNGQGGNSK